MKKVVLSLIAGFSVAAVVAQDASGIAVALSDAGVEASLPLVKQTLWKNESAELKFGTSMNLTKASIGKTSIHDLVGPALELEVAVPGFEKKVPLKLKLFSLLTYTQGIGKLRLPASMTEFLLNLSNKFGAFIKQSDKSAFAAFLAYFWFANSKPSRKIAEKVFDKNDSKFEQKRMIASALLAALTAYAVKEFNNSKFGKAAAVATALAAAATVMPTSIVRAPVIA